MSNPTSVESNEMFVSLKSVPDTKLPVTTRRVPEDTYGLIVLSNPFPISNNVPLPTQVKVTFSSIVCAHIIVPLPVNTLDLDTSADPLMLPMDPKASMSSSIVIEK